MTSARPGGAGELDERLARLSALGEPVRRSLYLHVAAQPHEVSRDEAAAAIGIQRSLAAFHLDKLVEAGLLEASYRRLTGRTGPGAGRPAKLYRRSSAERAVSVPPRDYERAAELLAEVVEAAGDAPRTRLAEVARRSGRELGQDVRKSLGRRAGRQRLTDALMDALDRLGYQPYREGRALRLRNCPFHGVAERHPDVVCPMNQALLEGLLEGAQVSGVVARPDPRPGECCVTTGPVGSGGTRATPVPATNDTGQD